MNYVVISPVRNEERYLPLTLQCMAAQTVRPLVWVLIDDGSNDGTGRIMDEAAAQYPWLKALHRQDRGFRQAGGGVMEAFYDGYSQLPTLNSEPSASQWNFLVKLDGDLSFGPDYFEQCLKRFVSEPRLGIGGGTICNELNGVLVVESKVDPVFHVRGATKIYRRECWEQIGGLIRAPGWDTVDEVKANMLGWTTRTFPGLKLVHHRPAGQAYGQWSNLIKNGRANYIAGYHPLFMLLKCIRRCFGKPLLLEGCGLWLGFLSGYLKGIPQVPDPEVLRYFRRQQLNRLLGKQSLWSACQVGSPLHSANSPPPVR